MEYCDYIAHRVQLGIKEAIDLGIGHLLTKVGAIQSDLHPTEGWFQSSTKTIEVTDKNGQKYKVTVEAVEE